MKKANGGFVNNEDDIRRIVRERTPGYEYVGGYTGSEGTLRIRCKTCGTEVVRSIISVRHNSLKCKECSRRENEARKAARKAEAERKRKEAEAEKEKIFWARPTKQETFRICKVCGDLFLSDNPSRITCGSSCTQKLWNRKDRRVRYRGITVDRDITLEELYRRDKGICHICGGECDWDDVRYNEDGVRIAGETYPSIDHVIPVSKGGLHAWNNVRLAHRHCNTIKGAAV